jgi:hypothetical protein
MTKLSTIIASMTPHFFSQPVSYSDQVTWTNSTNALWDLTSWFASNVTIPDGATVLFMSWGASIGSDTMGFSLLDADGNNVGSAYYSSLDEGDHQYGVAHPVQSTIQTVPASTRKINFDGLGGHYHTYANARRNFSVYGYA